MGFFSKSVKPELEKTNEKKELDIVNSHQIKLKKLQEKKARLQAKKAARLVRMKKRAELTSEKRAIRELRREEMESRMQPIRRIQSKMADVGERYSKSMSGGAGGGLSFGSGSKFDMGMGRDKGIFTFERKGGALDLGSKSKAGGGLSLSVLGSQSKEPTRRRRHKKRKKKPSKKKRRQIRGGGRVIIIRT